MFWVDMTTQKVRHAMILSVRTNMMWHKLFIIIHGTIYVHVKCYILPAVGRYLLLKLIKKKKPLQSGLKREVCKCIICDDRATYVKCVFVNIAVQVNFFNFFLFAVYSYFFSLRTTKQIQANRQVF